MPAEKESNFIDHLARCIPRAAPESPREQARFSPVSSQAQVTWRACVQQTTTSAASVHYMSTFTQPHAVFTAFTERRNIDLHTVWRIRETAALALSLECYLKGSGPYWLAVYLRKGCHRESFARSKQPVKLFLCSMIIHWPLDTAFAAALCVLLPS